MSFAFWKQNGCRTKTRLTAVYHEIFVCFPQKNKSTGNLFIEHVLRRRNQKTGGGRSEVITHNSGKIRED